MIRHFNAFLHEPFTTVESNIIITYKIYPWYLIRQRHSPFFFTFTHTQHTTQKMASLSVVTKQESEIYDRQIRLWGIEAQQRLPAAAAP